MRRFNAENAEQVRVYAMNYASRYEVSEQKLVQYLKRKFEKSPELETWIQSAVEACVRIQAVKDERVYGLLSDKLKRQGKGSRHIQMKIKSWGLEQHMQPTNREDEIARAGIWVEKFRSKNLDDKKIMQRLAARGFEFPTILEAMKRGKYSD